jgi:hypothetical protein
MDGSRQCCRYCNCIGISCFVRQYRGDNGNIHGSVVIHKYSWGNEGSSLPFSDYLPLTIHWEGYLIIVSTFETVVGNLLALKVFKSLESHRGRGF